MAGGPAQMATPEFRASHVSITATGIECSEAKSLTEGWAEPICPSLRVVYGSECIYEVVLLKFTAMSSINRHKEGMKTNEMITAWEPAFTSEG